MNTISTRAVAGRFAGVLGLTWLVAYFAARLILKRTDVEEWVRIAVALAPTPLFAAFLVSFLRGVRAADELHRKIQAESLAIAFLLTGLLLTTLALMQRAVNLSFENWSYAHVWIYLPIFYFGAFAFNNRRYSDE